MAAARPSSAIAAFQIPHGAVTNNNAFRSLPPGVTDGKRHSFVQAHAMLHLCLGSARLGGFDVESVVTIASLSDKPSGGIFPPPSGESPPRTYFTNVLNHPDIMTTIVNTARITAGFTATPVLTKEEAQQQLNQFQQFIRVLDMYAAYISLESFNTRSTVDDSNVDCDALLDIMVSVIDNAMGSGSISEVAKIVIKDTIRQAAQFVKSNDVDNTQFINTGFIHINLAPTTGEIETSRDPRCAILFYTITKMQASDTKAEGQLWESQLDIVALTYKLSSSSIIAYAAHLASSGITIISGKQFVELINAPIKSLT